MCSCSSLIFISLCMRAVSECVFVCFFAIYSMSNRISFKQQLRGERSQQMRYFRFTCNWVFVFTTILVTYYKYGSCYTMWWHLTSRSVLPNTDPCWAALWISHRWRCLLCSNSKWTDHSLHMQKRLRVFSFIYCMCLWSPKLSFTSLTWFMLFFVSDHLWSGQR